MIIQFRSSIFFLVKNFMNLKDQNESRPSIDYRNGVTMIRVKFKGSSRGLFLSLATVTATVI